MKLDWLIIGGGIHGVHIAARLLGEADVDRDRIRIVDPSERLLSRWLSCTKTTGMEHLRSPSVHNLDLNPWSLKQYAKTRKDLEFKMFERPYERPHLHLFNDHCQKVISAFGLSELHVQARALRCEVDCDGVVVQLSEGTEVSARNVVLAMGGGDHPLWPEWAPRDDPRVHHVFACGFDGWPSQEETVVVVGGGISASQVALRLMGEGHDVHVVSRHAMREHQFDSDPGWLGPKYMMRFHREKDLEKRRALITKARHSGSVPPDVRRSISEAITKGQLEWHEGDVDSLEDEGTELTMRLTTGVTVKPHRVLLATGFTGHRPGGALVDQLVRSASLPCAKCGYPIVDKSLRWHPQIYVTGPLAELELGPTSRNIAGARRAAERLVEAARAS